MNEETTIFETETNNYDGDYSLDTCDYTGDCESEGNETMKYVAVAAAAIGAFVLVQKGVKAIVKKVKGKKDEEDEPKKKKRKKVEDEEIIEVEAEDIEEVEEDVDDIEEDTEKYPAKKKKKK